MNLIIAAVVLAGLAALLEYMIGIAEPWKKIIIAGIVVIFVLGILMVFGLLPFRW